MKLKMLYIIRCAKIFILPVGRQALYDRNIYFAGKRRIGAAKSLKPGYNEHFGIEVLPLACRQMISWCKRMSVFLERL